MGIACVVGDLGTLVGLVALALAVLRHPPRRPAGVPVATAVAFLRFEIGGGVIVRAAWG
jgi:hypothetical protein